ncbi:hypothetical protein ABGB07_02210 [Micromonosporaceae bacterium B7E4]
MTADYRLITSSPIEVRQDPATGDVVIRNIHDPHSAIVATGDEWVAFAGQMAALPPDTDTRSEVEYAVKGTWDTGEVTYWESDRAVAEIRAEEHAKRRAAGPWRIVSADVVQRTLITSVGPWVPVPTPPDGV